MTKEQCIGENGPMSAEECAQWLDRKYSRHGELEDRASAQMIRNQQKELAKLNASRDAFRTERDAIRADWIGTLSDNEILWARVQDCETGLRTYDSGHNSEYWLRYPEEPEQPQSEP